MISVETRAQIRRWFFAEHWKIGTIAQLLRIHPDTVRHAIESDRLHRAQTLRAFLTDPYVPFLRAVLTDILDFAARVVVRPAQAPHRP